MSDNPKYKRRWLQFTLRGLLLLTAVIAMPLGWMMHNVRQQKIAVEALKKRPGCMVLYGVVPGESSGFVEWLRNEYGEYTFRKVIEVVCGLQTTDAELVHLRCLDQISKLMLGGTQITDAGLVHVHDLAQLKSLSLGRTQITDAGMVHFRGLNQLGDWTSAKRRSLTLDW